MKCPKCGFNVKRKYGMSCNCGYRFVFDPKSPPFISDKAFHSLLQSASSQDTRYFTINSLYGVMKRKFKRRPSNLHWIFILAFFITFFVTFNGIFLFIAIIYTGYIIAKSVGAKGIGYTELKAAMDKWQKSNLKSEFYIEKLGLHQPPPEYGEKDIYDYGVEKVILVDQDITVDYLVKNKEHINAKALVLSTSGYPSYVQDILKKTLTEQPQVPIMLLHGLRVNQKQMINQLKQNTGIDLTAKNIVDAAIHEDQLGNKKLVKGFDKQDLNRLSIDMLPYAAVAMVAAMGIEALAQFAQTGERGMESSFGDFG